MNLPKKVNPKLWVGGANGFWSVASYCLLTKNSKYMILQVKI